MVSLPEPDEAEGVSYESRDIFRVCFGLLGTWFCVPPNMNEDELEEFTKACRAQGVTKQVTDDDEMIIDRVYGGFPCPDHEKRQHVYFSAGQFSFTRGPDHPANGPLSSEQKREKYEKLIEANSESIEKYGGFKTDAQFVPDWVEGLFCDAN